MLGGALFGVIGHLNAFVSNEFVADPNLQPVPVGALAGLSNRHHDATPVGVLGRQSSFDQRRIGDREGDRRRCVIALGTRDGDLDKLGCAFAIADNLVSEVEVDFFDSCGERRVARVVDRLNRFVPGGARSEEPHRVAGRGVRVHGDPVVGASGGVGQDGLQHVG